MASFYIGVKDEYTGKEEYVSCILGPKEYMVSSKFDDAMFFSLEEAMGLIEGWKPCFSTVYIGQ